MIVLGVPASPPVGGPCRAVWSPLEMPEELWGMTVPSGSVTLPSWVLMFTLTFTVVVALALP